MYQLATDCRTADKTRLFIQTCTSMRPTAENLHLVDSATSLFKSVLAGADIRPLRDFVRDTATWCSDIDDVVAAAGQTVLDELDDSSRTDFHAAVRRVAQIERDALALSGSRSMEGTVRTAYAG